MSRLEKVGALHAGAKICLEWRANQLKGAFRCQRDTLVTAL